MKQLCATLSLLFLLLGSLFGQAQQDGVAASDAASSQLKFRGTLTDDSGRPLSGVVVVRFQVYKEERGGVPLWSETQNVQADATGRYAALLGSTTAEGMPLSLLHSPEVRWVSTQIAGQEESARAAYVLSGGKGQGATAKRASLKTGGLGGTEDTSYSGNWAGYVVTGSKFTLATTRWPAGRGMCLK